MALKHSGSRSPGRKRASQRAVADQLFSKLVRSEGRCEAADFHPFPCSGNLQCAHGFSRRYLATRYERANAWALCAASHLYWTMHPLEWDEFMRQELSPHVYAALRRKALAGGRPDYASIIPKLRYDLEQQGTPT